MGQRVATAGGQTSSTTLPRGGWAELVVAGVGLMDNWEIQRSDFTVFVDVIRNEG